MARSLAQADQEIRQLRAERDVLSQQYERLSEAMIAKDHELAEAHQQLRKTKQQLSELLQAIQNLSEQHQHLLRRHFAASSERVLCDETYLREVIAQSDPELAQMMADLAECEEQAITCVATDEQTDQPTHHDVTHESSSDVTTTAEQNGGAADEDTTTNAPEVPVANNYKRPANSGGRKPLPEHLPRQETFYRPDDDHPALTDAKVVKELKRTVIERLAIRPMEPYIAAYNCPVLRLAYSGGITTQQVIAPPAILPKGQVEDALLTYSVCAKVCDHLPTYRQSQQFDRIDLSLHRSKLARWHIATAEFLESIAQAVLYEVAEEPVIGIDDTVHRLLDVELHRCKHGRLWAIQGSTSTYYFFTETREGKWIEQVLGDYIGAIMGDAYSGHNALLRRRDITALFCWAHVRRKFYNASKGLKRDQALTLITGLYRIESECAQHPPDTRRELRNTHARPLLAQFKQLLDAWQADPYVLSKSGIGRATQYALNQWDGLIAYLAIGDAPIDNNHTERAMRPNALHRKNSLFSASVKGAESYAILSTLIHSACAHGLNPQTYLDDIINDVHYQRYPAEELTPAAYACRQGLITPVKQPC